MDIREDIDSWCVRHRTILGEHWGMAREVNVLALVKEDQRYVFLYDDASHDELLQTFGRYASDPELNFSWYDAAVMSQRVRALRKQYAQEQQTQQTPSGTHPHWQNSRIRDAA